MLLKIGQETQGETGWGGMACGHHRHGLWSVEARHGMAWQFLHCVHWRSRLFMRNQRPKCMDHKLAQLLIHTDGALKVSMVSCPVFTCRVACDHMPCLHMSG